MQRSTENPAWPSTASVHGLVAIWILSSMAGERNSAHVGFREAGMGVNSDITSEAAGAVILQPPLGSVDELIHISTKMRRIALTSAIGGMGLSMIGIAASALGYLKPLEGAVLRECIDLLSILYALRVVVPGKPVGDFFSPQLGRDLVREERVTAA